MSDEPNAMSCLEFQEHLAELFSSGSDVESHLIFRTAIFVFPLCAILKLSPKLRGIWISGMMVPLNEMMATQNQERQPFFPKSRIGTRFRRCSPGFGIRRIRCSVLC